VVIQEQAADLLLSVRDNLLTFARFHGRFGRAVRERAERVMAQFGIGEVADRKVQDLSGGIRRRVQVAKMFMIDAPVVFLDEFSSGMDAILKRSVIAMLRAEAAAGRTIVLTTQILTEAEELCDDILIIDRGRQVARGTVPALKQLIGGLQEVTITFDRIPEALSAIVAGFRPERVVTQHTTVQLQLRGDEPRVLELVSELGRHAHIQHLEITGASLEDVFVQLTERPRASA
jgi:ABC-type multidrug transport system ATPase subunit